MHKFYELLQAKSNANITNFLYFLILTYNFKAMKCFIRDRLNLILRSFHQLHHQSRIIHWYLIIQSVDLNLKDYGHKYEGDTNMALRLATPVPSQNLFLPHAIAINVPVKKHVYVKFRKWNVANITWSQYHNI